MVVCGCTLQQAVCERGKALLEEVRRWYQVVYEDRAFLSRPSIQREECLCRYEQAKQAYLLHSGEIALVL